MMKKPVLIAAALLTAAACTLTAYAGEWKQSDKGWWYDNGDNTYPKDEWVWIDGDDDGVSECYYFDADGYLLTGGTAPDGSTVDADGRWTVDGEVQTRAAGGEVYFEKSVAGRMTLHWKGKYPGSKDAVKVRLHITCRDENGNVIVNPCNGRDEMLAIYKGDLKAGSDMDMELVIGYSSEASELTVNSVDQWEADGTGSSFECGIKAAEKTGGEQ